LIFFFNKTPQNYIILSNKKNKQLPFLGYDLGEPPHKRTVAPEVRLGAPRASSGYPLHHPRRFALRVVPLLSLSLVAPMVRHAASRADIFMYPA
jgi:hypothetical protein